MRGRLHIQTTTNDGRIIDSRDACNSVLKAGGELVARLFTRGGTPITHMGVGASDAPVDDAFTITSLTNPDSALAGAVEVALEPDAFTVETDEVKRLVRVRVRGTLPRDAAVGTILEAGLLSRTEGQPPVLYNRVTFAPIKKGDDHELTMFWEVSFPYGDLHWMF